MRPATLARLPEPRRSASLAALFGALEGIAIDEGLELFDQLIDQTVKDAARAYVASRMRTSSCFSTTTTTFRCNKSWPELTPPRSRTPSNERDTSLARPTIGISGNCAHRGDGFKRLFEGLLGRVTFEAAPSAEPVREALAFLAHTPDWTKTPMSAAPTACAAWSRHVFTGGVKRSGAPVADNQAYAFAVLEATRKALKRRDIFVAASARFADLNRGMLEDAAWVAARPAVLSALGRSEDARDEINRLCEQLNTAYQRANANLPHNPARISSATRPCAPWVLPRN